MAFRGLVAAGLDRLRRSRRDSNRASAVRAAAYRMCGLALPGREYSVVEWYVIAVPIAGMVCAFICWAACYVGSQNDID